MKKNKQRQKLYNKYKLHKRKYNKKNKIGVNYIFQRSKNRDINIKIW